MARFARYVFGMTIFLGYTTALRYWRSMRTHNRYGILMERSSAQPATVSSPAEERAAEEAAARVQFCPHNEPLHVVVSVASARLRASDAVYHVKSCVFPRRSFIAAQEGVFISSPELCYLQMAEELELPDLVQLGFEFCGSYGMRDQDEPIGKSEEGLDFGRRAGKAVSWLDADYEMAAGREEGAGSAGYLPCAPLMSVASLERFISRCDGQYGVKKARDALRYVADNAASPMEAKLVTLLCLPRIKGDTDCRFLF